AVLIEGDEFSENLRSQFFCKDGVRGTIPFKDTVRDQPVGCSFLFDLFFGFAEGQCFRLCKHVGNEHVMMTTQGIERLSESNEIARDQPGSLMNQLIE